MREKRREPEVPAVECSDVPARITLKELATIHSVKNGILQNACYTKTRMVAVLGKSAHSPHLLSHSFHFFSHLKFVDNLRIPPKESMGSFDETNERSGRPRVVADLGRSARMHIVRFLNNLVNGPEGMMTRVQ